MLVKIDKGHVSLYGEIRPPVKLDKAINIIRDSIVLQTMLAFNGNKMQVAKALGIPRSTLLHHLGQAAIRRRANESWGKVIEV